METIKLSNALRSLADEIEKRGVRNIKLGFESPLKEIEPSTVDGVLWANWEHTGEYKIFLHFWWGEDED